MRGDFRQDSTCHARIFARSEQLVGIENVDQMMRDAAAVIGGELGGTNVKITIYLQGVAVDDLARELRGHTESQVALP